MKIILLFAAAIGLSVSSASAIDFKFRYNLADGSYFTGTFEGDINPREYYIQNLIPGGGTYFTASGDEVFGAGFNSWGGTWGGWYYDLIPANGSGEGLDFDFNRDGDGFDRSIWMHGPESEWGNPGILVIQYFISPGGRDQRVYVREKFEPGRWSISPTFLTAVPDEGATCFMFGASLLGLYTLQRKSLTSAAR